MLSRPGQRCVLHPRGLSAPVGGRCRLRYCTVQRLEKTLNDEPPRLFPSFFLSYSLQYQSAAEKGNHERLIRGRADERNFFTRRTDQDLGDLNRAHG